MLITEFSGRFGIPTLQAAVLPSVRLAPQRHHAVHAETPSSVAYCQRAASITEAEKTPTSALTPTLQGAADPGGRSWLWFQLSDTEAPSWGLSRQDSCLRISASHRETQHQEGERDQIPRGKLQHLPAVWAQRD